MLICQEQISAKLFSGQRERLLIITKVLKRRIGRVLSFTTKEGEWKSRVLCLTGILYDLSMEPTWIVKGEKHYIRKVKQSKSSFTISHTWDLRELTRISGSPAVCLAHDAG